MTRHYPDLGSPSDWSWRVGNLVQPIRSTNRIWVVTRHHIWNFCARFSDVIWRGNQWQRRQMSAVSFRVGWTPSRYFNLHPQAFVTVEVGVDFLRVLVGGLIKWEPCYPTFFTLALNQFAFANLCWKLGQEHRCYTFAKSPHRSSIHSFSSADLQQENTLSES